MDKEEKEQYFQYFYSNPLLAYFQNWGHIITEKNIRRGNLILDLGCGAFDHLPFAQANKTYVELDLDFAILQIGRKKYPLQPCICANAEKMPFKSNSFDNIISVFNLEHIQDLGLCVQEISRVLKPGGHLSASIPTEGFVFRLGRRLTSARYAKKHLGFKSFAAYEQYVSRNHVNNIDNIFHEVKHYLKIIKSKWFPFQVFGGRHLNVNVALLATPLNKR